VIISGSVDDLFYDAFSQSFRISTLIMNGTVKRIGSLVFSNIHSLESVTLPSTLEVIGYSAFHECSDLRNITIPASVHTIGEDPFSCCYALENIFVEDGNQIFESVDGVLFNTETKTLIQYPAGKEEGASYTIPNGTIIIGNGAFSNSDIKTVSIPETVTTIEVYAFEDCHELTEVAIPDGVTVIPYYGFARCRELKSVSIPDSVTVFDSECFYECPKLESIYLPPNTTEIGSSAFSGCESLRTVTIPSGVETLRTAAFKDCKGLTAVFYQGRNAFDSNYPFQNCGSLKYVCVSPRFEGNYFAERKVTPEAEVCIDFQSYFNGCYAPYYTDGEFGSMAKMLDAIQWEEKTNPCGQYQCTNESGFIGWSLCNSSTSSICVNSKCVVNWEEYLAGTSYDGWLEIFFNGVRFLDFSYEDVKDDFSKIHWGVEYDSFGIETDNFGNVPRLIAFGFSESVSEQLNAMDKYDFKIFCKIKTTVYHSMSKDPFSTSGAESIHSAMMKGIVALFFAVEMILISIW